MNTSACNDLAHILPSYLDGELEEQDKQAIEQHLNHCNECSNELETAAEVRQQLRAQLDGIAASASLRQSVSCLLDQEDVRYANERRRNQWSWALPGFACSAAIAALAVFFVSDFSPETNTQNRVGTPQLAGRGLAIEATPAEPVLVTKTRLEASQMAERHLNMRISAPQFRNNAQIIGWQPSRIDGQQAAAFVYEVRSPSRRHLVKVHVLDARNVDLRGNMPIQHRGTHLWTDMDTDRNSATVVYKDHHGTGYVFTATDMSTPELIQVVGESDVAGVVGDSLAP